MLLPGLMGGLLLGQSSGGGGSPGGTDPLYSSVELLLHLDGADGATSTTDSGPNGRTVSFQGLNAQLDAAQSKFGGSSLLLDGNGYLQVFPSSAFSVANSDGITIETWIMRAATGAVHTVANKRDASGAEEFTFNVNASNLLNFATFVSGAVDVSLQSTTTFSTGAWHHVAVCRSSGTWRLFVNGTQEASGAESFLPSSNTAPLFIGHDGFNGSRKFNGWIDEFRFTRAARYTSSFTPPTAAFPDS